MLTVPLCEARQQEEHPNVNSENQTHLEHDFSQYEFAQEKGPVHHHQGKLQYQHHKKGNWNFVFLQIRRHSTVSLLRLKYFKIFSLKKNNINVKTYAKRGESKNDNHEVEKVTHEHESVHVSSDSATWLQQLGEEPGHTGHQLCRPVKINKN